MEASNYIPKSSSTVDSEDQNRLRRRELTDSVYCVRCWRLRPWPDSFQWCPLTGQGAIGTNWSTGSSVWTWGRTSSLWGWRSTGTGCPGRLFILLLWRYSRPAWTRSCAAYCRWSCFGRGIGLADPQRSLPTPTILWFCNIRGKRSFQLFFFLPLSAVHKFSSLKMKLCLLLFSSVGPEELVTFFAYGKRDKEVC